MQTSWAGAISLYAPNFNCLTVNQNPLFHLRTQIQYSITISDIKHIRRSHQVTDSSQDSGTFENHWYRLDSLGIKSLWVQDFMNLSRPPWGPPSLLYHGYWVSFLGVKWLGSGTDNPPPSSTEVKKWVELYLYSPSRPSWPVLGWNLLLPLPLKTRRISTNDTVPLMHGNELSWQLGEPHNSYIMCNNKWNCYAQHKMFVNPVSTLKMKQT